MRPPICPGLLLFFSNGPVFFCLPCVCRRLLLFSPQLFPFFQLGGGCTEEEPGPDGQTRSLSSPLSARPFVRLSVNNQPQFPVMEKLFLLPVLSFLSRVFPDLPLSQLCSVDVFLRALAPARTHNMGRAPMCWT